MRNPGLTSLIFALVFIFFGCLWIIISDHFLVPIFPRLIEMTYFQTFKGLAFVFICGILIFLLFFYLQKRLIEQQKQIAIGEENYTKLFLNNPLPMWVYDIKTLCFTAVNNAAVVQYGYTKEEFAKMNLLDIRPPEDHKALMENIVQENDLTYTLSGKWRHVKKDGTVIFVEINSHTIDFNGRPSKIVLALDVTERVEAEKEIQGLLFELDNFVYRASHDIRGPLARLRGLSQVALMDIQEEKARKYFNLINQSANVLDNTLVSLLSINNLKHTLLEECEVNLHELVDNIIKIKMEVLNKANISFINEIAKDLTIKSDSNILRLTLQNMLDNSIQYCNQELAQRYIKVYSVAQNHHVKLFIEDNGMGIEESQVDKIFNIFHRGTEKSQGSGLGLYIAKVAMSKLKGSINLLDHRKKHTVFELLIPMAAALNSAFDKDSKKGSVNGLQSKKAYR